MILHKIDKVSQPGICLHILSFDLVRTSSNKLCLKNPHNSTLEPSIRTGLIVPIKGISLRGPSGGDDIPSLKASIFGCLTMNPRWWTNPNPTEMLWVLYLYINMYIYIWFWFEMAWFQHDMTWILKFWLIHSHCFVAWVSSLIPFKRIYINMKHGWQPICSQGRTTIVPKRKCKLNFWYSLGTSWVLHGN